MGDDILKKLNYKELVEITRYKVVEGQSNVFVVVFCRLEGKKKMSVTLSVDKNRYLANRMSVLSDVVTRGIHELYQLIAQEMPEVIP